MAKCSSTQTPPIVNHPVGFYGLILIFFLLVTGCQAQTQKDMKKESNPLLCSPESGLCALPSHLQDGDSAHAHLANDSKKVIRVIYFTDPICSSCWGIEPQLRRLKLEYGAYLEIEYHMGGLLPDWSYNSGGISKPSDVAHHWDEVSVYYDMPIDGDVWLEDPLASSYPPSIAFKAAELQDPTRALVFLRRIREMVFLQKKNITKWVHLADAARLAGLDTHRLHQDFEGQAVSQFQSDLALARTYGVRGFPTLIFEGGKGTEHEVLYGARPYDSFRNAVLKIYPAATAEAYEKSWQALFARFGSLTAREYAELGQLPRIEAERQLNELAESKKLRVLRTKNGAIWMR